MKLILNYLYVLSIACFLLFSCSSANSQEKKASDLSHTGIIMKYDSEREGIQTAGGDSTMHFKIYGPDRTLIKKGKLLSSFITLPSEEFKPGKYQIIFIGENRYVHRTFIIPQNKEYIKS